MPTLDLWGSDNVLDPIAHWRIAAVMAYPSDRSKRYRFVEKGRRLYRQRDDKLLKRALTEFRQAASGGRIAGDLLLYFLQMDEHHGAASLNRVLPLTRAALLHDARLPLEGLRQDDLQSAGWHDTREALHGHPIHRPAMLAFFRTYRPVAHFWGAYEVALLEDRPDLDFLKSPDNIPRFAALASALAQRAAKIPFNRKPREVLLPPHIVWNIRVPGALTEHFCVDIPPLSPLAVKLATPGKL